MLTGRPARTQCQKNDPLIEPIDGEAQALVPGGGVQEAASEPTIDGSPLWCSVGSRRVRPGYRDRRSIHTGAGVDVENRGGGGVMAACLPW